MRGTKCILLAAVVCCGIASAQAQGVPATKPMVPPHLPALADGAPSADSSEVVVQFSRTFGGAYRPGQPYDVLTIAPGSGAETLAETGISIQATLRYTTGTPMVGMPRGEIGFWSPSLFICPGGTIADSPTDLYGNTTFSGSLVASGCAESLPLYVWGVLIATIPVKTNSPDLNADGVVDASDIAALAPLLGSRAGDAHYTICNDFNEDGGINAGDIAFLAVYLGDVCASR